MKFKVTRTSMDSFFDKDKKPCDNAIWYDGQWSIELHTLDDLVEFTEDKIVFSGDAIEIYDDYRE